MQRWSLLAVPVLLLAGCLQSPTSLPAGATVDALELRLPVHVVAVGFEAFDASALRESLAPLLPQFKWVRAYTTGSQEPEPLQYKIDYQVHQAPPEFAQALFDFAKTVSRPDQPDRSLAEYDAAGEQRVCTPSPVPPVPMGLVTPPASSASPSCKDIQRIDAAAVEGWIAANRAAYGLDFGRPGQTLFVLDSYTRGHLDPASYHQYEVKAPAQTSEMRTMRAWGGAHDFVFLDVGAAPNGYDDHPFGSYGEGAPDLTQLRDGPIWEYGGDLRPFYANLGRNVADAVRMLWARDPIYPFEYAERYVLPFFVFIDPNAHYNPDSPLARMATADVAAHTDEAGIRQAFQDLAPWANVTVDFHYVYLPDGDAGVAQALKDAKERSSRQAVDFGIVKRYFRENWDRYVPDVPGAKVYPTFAFLLDAPSTGIYAYSDGDEAGGSWGVFVNIADAVDVACRIPPAIPCFPEDAFGGPDVWWAWWNAVLVHELGHSFGLTHTHDTPGKTAAGELTYDVNWLWDSTSSAMTYRHTLPTFNAFDKELLLRGHATELALRVLRASPAAPIAEQARAALARVVEGDYAGAFEAARTAAFSGAVDLGLGVRGTVGTPLPVPFEVPATGAPLGELDPLAVLSTVGVPVPDTAQRFPIDLPAGATAFRLEVREGEAPSRAGWGAYVAITDSAGKVLGGLFNNGYDVGIWEALDKCKGTCEGRLVAYSGARSSYTVTVTPLFGEGPWPKA